MLNLPWQGFEKKNFTKIKAHAGMAERLVRDLAIEGSSGGNKRQNTTINHMVNGVLNQTDKGKNNTSFSLFRNVCITPQPCHSHFCC